MKAAKENVAIIGVGAVACAACCAGPILGFLAAIGLGTAAGFALFGTAAIVAGALAVLIVVLRQRRRRVDACDGASEPVAVDVPIVRAPR